MEVDFTFPVSLFLPFNSSIKSSSLWANDIYLAHTFKQKSLSFTDCGAFSVSFALVNYKLKSIFTSSS